MFPALGIKMQLVQIFFFLLLIFAVLRGFLTLACVLKHRLFKYDSVLKYCFKKSEKNVKVWLSAHVPGHWRDPQSCK